MHCRRMRKGLIIDSQDERSSSVYHPVDQTTLPPLLFIINGVTASDIPLSTLGVCSLYRQGSMQVLTP